MVVYTLCYTFFINLCISSSILFLSISLDNISAGTPNISTNSSTLFSGITPLFDHELTAYFETSIFFDNSKYPIPLKKHIISNPNIFTPHYFAKYYKS